MQKSNYVMNYALLDLKSYLPTIGQKWIDFLAQKMTFKIKTSLVKSLIFNFKLRSRRSKVPDEWVA